MAGIYEWYAADSQRLRDELDTMREEAAARGVQVSVIERERAEAARERALEQARQGTIARHAAAEHAQPGGGMPEGSPPPVTPTTPGLRARRRNARRGSRRRPSGARTRWNASGAGGRLSGTPPPQRGSWRRRAVRRLKPRAKPTSTGKPAECVS